MSKPSREMDIGFETETAMSTTSADDGPSGVKVKLCSVTESGEPFVANIVSMVNIGFDTETTMPKVSREKPRVVIDSYVGWELEVMSATNKEPNPRPVTVVERQDISPDYDWSKLMPPTERLRGELVVEPGWKYEQPQFFRVWVYPKRDYLLGTEWSDIEVAAADNNFMVRILLEKGVERWYIFTALGLGPKDPKHSKDPWAFPKAIRFSELLATTNVPPSVVIDILYGRLGHRYLPIGCQQGGLCLKHYISHYAFCERYNRFISSTEDLLDILGPGISLYLTGNTICVVGKPEQDLQLDMVVSFAKRCIIKNEEPANLLKVGSEWLQKLSKKKEEALS